MKKLQLILLILLCYFTLNAQRQNNFNEKVQKFTDSIEIIVNAERDSMKITFKKLELLHKEGNISAKELEDKKKEISIKHAQVINELAPKLENDFSKLLQEKINTTVKKNYYEKTDKEKLIKLKNQYRYVPWGHLDFEQGFSNMIDGFDFGSMDNSGLKFNKSNEYNFNLLYTDRFNEFTSPFLFSVGLGFSQRNLFLDENKTFGLDTNGNTTLINHPINFDKSKIRLSYLTLPLELEYDFGKKSIKDNLLDYREVGKFRVGLGIYGGLKIGEMSKIQYRNSNNSRITEKNRNGVGFNDFIYGAKLTFKYKTISVYIKKDFSELHNSSYLPNQGISFGITLPVIMNFRGNRIKYK